MQKGVVRAAQQQQSRVSRVRANRRHALNPAKTACTEIGVPTLDCPCSSTAQGARQQRGPPVHCAGGDKAAARA